MVLLMFIGGIVIVIGFLIWVDYIQTKIMLEKLNTPKTPEEIKEWQEFLDWANLPQAELKKQFKTRKSD